MESQNDRIWSYDSLRNFREISPAVQKHLITSSFVLFLILVVVFLIVYITLCFDLLVSAFGAYLHMLWNIGGLFTRLGFIGTMICLRITPTYEHLSKRLSLLFLSALLKSASVGPTIQSVIDFDSSIVITVFVGNAVAFVCFSAAAMFSRRREYIYLGATLSSGVSILWWVQFAPSIIRGSTFFLKSELYFGLLIFVFYIVVDTQVIIEKAHSGDMDYVNHSFTFFTDFASLFGRVLTLKMMKKMKGKTDSETTKTNMYSIAQSLLRKSLFPLLFD